uniref:Galanin peptides n=1 Tax=Bos taurus TaxID=9913 RepID=A0AAA9S2M5_BOVIN
EAIHLRQLFVRIPYDFAPCCRQHRKQQHENVCAAEAGLSLEAPGGLLTRRALVIPLHCGPRTPWEAASVCACPGLEATWCIRPGSRRPWRRSSPSPRRAPDALDSHRSFQDKHGLAGKRELEPEDEARPGSFDRPLAENNVVRTIIEFLTFLHLKDAGALERLPSLPTAESAEDAERS